MLNVHILQHVAFEGPGSIQAWLDQRDARVSRTRYDQSADLPDIDAVDLVIAMGGPMSVNDEAELPWLAEEKRFIRRAIDRGKAVVGICLGAQLIASALGARVYAGPAKEIGWLDVERVETAAAGVFRFPDRLSAFHWHGETFDLPQGATLLASSAGCAHQAFQFGPRVIGLQFHLESTPETVDAILSNCRRELVKGRYVQTEAAIRSAPGSAYRNINTLMAQVLDYVVQGAVR